MNEAKKLPQQYTGASSAVTYSIKTPGHNAAQKLFQHARKNLLNVNRWHLLTGASSAEFTVVDEHGKETHTAAVIGNYLRIALPVAPGAPAGKGYDWVRIEKIEEHQWPDHQYVFMRVRPAVPPFYDKNEVGHFFSDDATSTFIIERKGKKVIAAVYGRNEKPNTGVRHFFNKIRNVLIAWAAMIGLNKPQWRGLVKGLLKN